MFDTLCHFERFLTLWRHDICITLRWQCNVHNIVTWRYVFYIVNMLVCSSHCDDMVCSSHCDDMVYSSHCNVTMFVIMRHYHVHHIVTLWLCSSHYDDRAHYDNMAMFIALWKWGYVPHIVMTWYLRHIATLLYLLEWDSTMFVTLIYYGYVCHIVTTRLFLSHCVDDAMFITL
jgi:hypothetical protein